MPPRKRSWRSPRTRTTFRKPFRRTFDDATAPVSLTDNQIVNDPTTRASLLRRSLQQMLAFGGLIAIFIVFSIASPDVFPSYTNVIQILFSAVVIGLLALGSTLVIITAGIDLSVGTGMALCAVMSATFIVTWHIPVVLGVILAILFGGLIGMVNGFSVALMTAQR